MKEEQKRRMALNLRGAKRSGPSGTSEELRLRRKETARKRNEVIRRNSEDERSRLPPERSDPKRPLRVTEQDTPDKVRRTPSALGTELPTVVAQRAEEHRPTGGVLYSRDLQLMLRDPVLESDIEALRSVSNEVMLHLSRLNFQVNLRNDYGNPELLALSALARDEVRSVHRELARSAEVLKRLNETYVARHPSEAKNGVSRDGEAREGSRAVAASLNQSEAQKKSWEARRVPKEANPSAPHAVFLSSVTRGLTDFLRGASPVPQEEENAEA